MKKCFKCGELKDFDCFYKHSLMKDGRVNKCKECYKKDVIENYYKNHEYYIEYDRSRVDNEKRKEKRKNYSSFIRKNFPDKVKEYKSRYDKNKKNATTKVEKALKKGIIVKTPCIICGNEKSEGHHPDYSKPLEVIWLCKKHHGLEHRKINRSK